MCSSRVQPTHPATRQPTLPPANPPCQPLTHPPDHPFPYSRTRAPFTHPPSLPRVQEEEEERPVAVASLVEPPAMNGAMISRW